MLGHRALYIRGLYSSRLIQSIPAGVIRLPLTAWICRSCNAHSGARRPSDSASSLPVRPQSSSISTQPQTGAAAASTATYPPGTSTPSSLSILPLPAVLRSLFVTSVSSSPLLLGPSLAILSFVSRSKSTFLDPDKNPLIKQLLRQTLYAQFCAGETTVEVKARIQELKDIGFAGVILGFAKEVVMDESEANALSHGVGAEDTVNAAAEITVWRDGTLATVDLAGDGDFVALKFTGAGRQVLQCLLDSSPPSKPLDEAMVQICDKARARNVRLLIDAEQQAVQPTIDNWTLDFQRRYNRQNGERALIYGTYQAYLKSTPTTLSKHISIAQEEGFALGVKLVRGAYLGTEPRQLIWERKEDTDRTYNSLAECLVKKEYGSDLQPVQERSSSGDSRFTTSETLPFPEVNLVLASHNRYSVKRAQELRTKQLVKGEKHIDLAYGQLQGMADDISCDLVHWGKTARERSDVDVPKVYKSLVWGSVGECTKYLIRRGEENRDAASRTHDTRTAMAKELRRRIFSR